MLPVDIADAIKTVLDKTNNVSLGSRWAYYSGNQPKIWITPKVAETFRGLADSLSENYCATAVNARISRLEITGWDGASAEAASQVWDEGGFPQRQDVMFRWGLVHGTAYLVVQDDLIAVNSAAICHAEPSPDDWLNVAWAGKAVITDGYWHVTLWDETTLYRYTGPEAIVKEGRTAIPTPDSFTPSAEGEAESHGYPRVPVFPINPYGYMAPALIDQIAPIQDRINKLSANKFVAAEFGAFKQRVFFTRQQVDPFDLKQAPDTAIVLDPGDADGRASVQELGATDLRNYDDAKNAEVDALFTIAALPRHMRVNPGAVPSGEAIKADEGPFVEALHDHQREFGEALISALTLLGIDAEPVWRDVEPHDDLINAQIVATLVAAGIPWQIAAQRYLGMSAEEIVEAEQTHQIATDAITAQTNAMLSNPTLGGNGA